MESLWIAGAGDLGARVAGRWTAVRGSLTLETQTTRRHALLQEFSQARVTTSSESSASSDDSCATHVLICFPPREDYIDQVHRALRRWNRSGMAILVSTTSVYLEDSGGVVDELSPVDESNPIVKAERLVLEARGHVLRVGGLYSQDSGPHRFWEKLTRSPSLGEGWINLIHREDAAKAIFHLLRTPLPGALWNLSDGNPLTRQVIAQIWADHRGAVPCQFSTEGHQGFGKKLIQSRLQKLLKWNPRWKSFGDFVASLQNEAAK